MFKKIIGGALLVGGASFMVLPVASATTAPTPVNKVLICHRTGSANGGNQHNGYDFLNPGGGVSVNSIFKEKGHDQHNKISNGPGGDIIPAFYYLGKTGTVQHYDGKNLGNGGQAFLDNGCKTPDKTVIAPPPPKKIVITTPPKTKTTVTTPPVATKTATKPLVIAKAPPVKSKPQVAVVPKGGVDTGNGSTALAYTGFDPVPLFGGLVMLVTGFVLLVVKRLTILRK